MRVVLRSAGTAHLTKFLHGESGFAMRLPLSILRMSVLSLLATAPLQAQSKIVHDAEYYIVAAQNGERWDAEDEALAEKLAELKKKFGQPEIIGSTPRS